MKKLNSFKQIKSFKKSLLTIQEQINIGGGQTNDTCAYIENTCEWNCQDTYTEIYVDGVFNSDLTVMSNNDCY